MQREGVSLGMWTFLASEVLFFGALMLTYTVCRVDHPAAFAAAGRETNVWYGTINTAVLLTSSLAMALAVHAAQESKTKESVRWLLLTILLAVGFLVGGVLERVERERVVVGSSDFFFDEAAEDAGLGG